MSHVCPEAPGRCVERIGFLTPKQLLIAHLRSRGLSSTEIAKLLGVSRQDVAIAAKRAQRNYTAALETIEAYLAATCPVVEAAPEEPPEEVAERLITLADKTGVKLPMGRGELATYIRAAKLVHGDRLCLALRRDGVPTPLDCRVVERVRLLLTRVIPGRRGGTPGLPGA